jgi:hypothetical protein
MSGFHYTPRATDKRTPLTPGYCLRAEPNNSSSPESVSAPCWRPTAAKSDVGINDVGGVIMKSSVTREPNLTERRRTAQIKYTTKKARRQQPTAEKHPLSNNADRDQDVENAMKRLPTRT